MSLTLIDDHFQLQPELDLHLFEFVGTVAFLRLEATHLSVARLHQRVEHTRRLSTALPAVEPRHQGLCCLREFFTVLSFHQQIHTFLIVIDGVPGKAKFEHYENHEDYKNGMAETFRARARERSKKQDNKMYDDGD